MTCHLGNWSGGASATATDAAAPRGRCNLQSLAARALLLRSGLRGVAWGAPWRARRRLGSHAHSRDRESNCRGLSGRAAQDAPLLGQRRGTDPCARVPSRGSRNNVVRVMAAADETLALVGLIGKKKDSDTVSIGGAFAAAHRSRHHPESLRRAHQVGAGADCHRIRARLVPPSWSCAFDGDPHPGRCQAPLKPGRCRPLALCSRSGSAPARWRIPRPMQPLPAPLPALPPPATPRLVARRVLS